MVQRLVFVIVGCAVLAAAFALLCRFAFPDVIPYMPGEDATFGWRREAAFLITTLAWVAAEASAVLSIVLAALLWKRHATKVRSS
jgi:hypothetical protein